MTKHARDVALAFRLQLDTVQSLGCVHGVTAWGLCTGSVFGALKVSGHVKLSEAAEWRSLCGIPTHAEQPREDAGGDIPPPKGRPS